MIILNKKQLLILLKKCLEINHRGGSHSGDKQYFYRFNIVRMDEPPMMIPIPIIMLPSWHYIKEFFNVSTDISCEIKELFSYHGMRCRISHLQKDQFNIIKK